MSSTSPALRSRVGSGALLVMAAAVLWGTTGTAQALSAYPGSSVGLGAARIGAAGLILSGVALAVHGRSVLSLLSRPGTRRYLVLGAAAMAAYQVSFFTAARMTGVAVGTLTTIGAAPLLAGLIGALIGHRPSRRWLLATAIAVVGLALLVTPGGDTTVNVEGVLAGLAAGAGYAVYTWCSRHLLDAGVPPIPLLAWLFVAGAAMVLPIGWRGTAGWFTDPGGLVVVGYLAVVATAVPYVMWIRGMATTAPAVATTLTLTEPLTAAVLGLLVLDEPLTVTLIAGAALLIAGLLLTVTDRVEAEKAVTGKTEAEKAVTGGSVADGAEQRADLAVREVPETPGLHVAEPDRADRGADQT